MTDKERELLLAIASVLVDASQGEGGRDCRLNDAGYTAFAKRDPDRSTLEEMAELAEGVKAEAKR